jgi:hypothetical protein
MLYGYIKVSFHNFYLQTAKRPAYSQGTAQPKKLLKIDRSFSNLDDSSKDASVFKWF